MAAYVVQRLGTVMLIMMAMSVLVFLATHALPSNAAALILGQYSTPETQAALEHKLGFDLPLPVQYWHWAKGMLEGDMGQSLEMERPVAPMLWDAFSRSAILAVSSLAVVATLGLTLWRRRRGVARPMAGSCRLDLHLFRRIAAGVLLGSRPHPFVRQHVPPAAFFRLRQSLGRARQPSLLISCCRSRP